MKDKLVYRILLAAVGQIICGIGIGLFIFSNLGVDPTSVFQLGIAKQLSITYGTASALMNIIIILVMLKIDRRYINIATFMAIFLIGYSADITNFILGKMIITSISFPFQLMLAIVGCVIMATGIPLYIFADLGVGAVDLISEAITDKMEVPYRMVRITIDTLFVIIGYILGGTLGIGTVIAAFLTGPIVQFTRPILHKFLSKTEMIGVID